jgi:hypothetical protein
MSERTGGGAGPEPRDASAARRDDGQAKGNAIAVPPNELPEASTVPLDRRLRVGC